MNCRCAGTVELLLRYEVGRSYIPTKNRLSRQDPAKTRRWIFCDFFILMQQSAYPIGRPDYRKEKQKTLVCFLFQDAGYRIPKSSPRKIRKISGKIQYDR